MRCPCARVGPPSETTTRLRPGRRNHRNRHHGHLCDRRRYQMRVITLLAYPTEPKPNQVFSRGDAKFSSNTFGATKPRSAVLPRPGWGNPGLNIPGERRNFDVGDTWVREFRSRAAAWLAVGANLRWYRQCSRRRAVMPFTGRGAARRWCLGSCAVRGCHAVVGLVRCPGCLSRRSCR